MKRILIAYTTNAGSTEDCARAVAAGVALPGDVVEVRRLEEVRDLDGWDAVIVGAPMILGWSRSAVRFVKRNREGLAQKQVAYFCTAMALTATDQVPQYVYFQSCCERCMACHILPLNQVTPSWSTA